MRRSPHATVTAATYSASFNVTGLIIVVTPAYPALRWQVHCASSPDYGERRWRNLQFPATDVHHVNGGSVHVAYVEP